MRTTLTLDDDVAAMLKKMQRKSSASFKETVNDALREGLKHSLKEPPPAPFRTRVHRGGKLLVNSIANIDEVLDLIEGPWRR